VHFGVSDLLTLLFGQSNAAQVDNFSILSNLIDLEIGKSTFN
jgi:hypothetical protein